MLETLLYWTKSAWLLFGCRYSAVHSRIAGISSNKTPVFQRPFSAMQTQTVRTFSMKIIRWKTCLKLFYIELRVYGYFLSAGTVLYIAGSLRYLLIKHPSFNAHSLQCKRKLYALFPCKIIRRKTCLELFYIEHRVYGYFLSACTVLYIAGSLRYLRWKHPSFNAHSLQCKPTLYALFPCKIHLLKV